MAMKKVGVVELTVRVRMEVPEHVVERDLREQPLEDAMRDYASACVKDVEVRHGASDSDWVSLSAEVLECVVEEELHAEE